MERPIKVPTNLTHKPIIVVENYEARDGEFANDTDAVGLSMGFAQYDEENISVKVWRHTGERWSRQSEELPPHRVLDLSILTIASFITKKETDSSLTNLGEIVLDKENFDSIEKYYEKNREKLVPKIKELKVIIDKFLEEKTPIKNRTQIAFNK